MENESILIDISSVLGLIATVVLTINMLLGILLSSFLNSPFLKQKQFKKLTPNTINNIHNYTAYIALLFVFAHVILIPLGNSSNFTYKDLIFPLNAPHQPTIVLFGFLAFLALITVIISTQKLVKRALGYSLWKWIHMISYGTCLLFIIHGLLMDPELKDRPTDWIDGEKLLVELCVIVLLIATYFRYKHYIYEHKKNNASPYEK